MASGDVLRVDGLTVAFRTEAAETTVVEDVSFAIGPGQTLGLVGESGCGKSVTAQSIMRLLPEPPARIVRGRVLFKDEDVVAVSANRLRELRGNRIAMIFQEPMTSLNPTLRVGVQIAEGLVLHRHASAVDARRQTITMLAAVGIGSPERRYDQYPHELSGGLRQRIMIAMALICRPELLIADEPTTALDVTVQAQILELLKRLQAELGLTVLLITHDLGVVAETSDRIAVMYAGRIVEAGGARDVLRQPHHPYTAGLLASSPRRTKRGERLSVVPGMVLAPLARGDSCSFAGRCARVQDRCRSERPPERSLAGDRRLACWNPVP